MLATMTPDYHDRVNNDRDGIVVSCIMKFNTVHIYSSHDGYYNIMPNYGRNNNIIITSDEQLLPCNESLKIEVKTLLSKLAVLDYRLGLLT